ncbi:hypothetical protein KR084_007734, partial [Drosophila pseudotakahashii]
RHSKNQLLCQCGRYYNTFNRLNLHQREECQDFKRFQCDFCLKWFKRRSHLNRHKKLHDAELFLEPLTKQKTKAKITNRLLNDTTTDDEVAAETPAVTDGETDYPYTSEIKIENDKYHLRTQETSTSPPDYPSTSRPKVGAVRDRKTVSPSPETVSLDQKSENEEPSDMDSAASLKKAMATSDAMIALQQLASISTARSLQHLVQNMSNIDSSALVPGRKLPRYATKRSPKYESNRCPLCSRVCRSQAFLNEHMRKEHSVLI